MDATVFADLPRFLVFVSVFAIFLLVVMLMFRAVAWSKKRPKGGYLMIAL